MRERTKPYLWASWLAPLLSGDDDCRLKVWVKAHYQDIEKRQRDDGFDQARWNEDHTALLNTLRTEYAGTSEVVLVEGQTAWKIDGRSATVAGKMDIVTLNPDLVIDAKTGKPKNAHVAQVKIYLVALAMGALRAIAMSRAPKVKGVLRYASGEVVDVPKAEAEFHERFFSLVRELASDDEPPAVPSVNECRFCDIAKCTERIEDAPAIATDAF